MKQKLFAVTIQTEIVVVAHDEPNAERTAKYMAREAWETVAGDHLQFSFELRPMRHLPAGYGLDEYPYENTVEQPELLEDPDHTVGEWIDLGAAPEYHEALAMLPASGIEPSADAGLRAATEPENGNATPTTHTPSPVLSPSRGR